MGRLLDLYCGVLKVAIALCLLAMVVLVFSNVVLRYVFNSGIATSEELSRWLLVWLTFLGAIVALRQHAHLGVDTLIRALPPKGKFVCFVASYLLMLYADWLLNSWQLEADNSHFQRHRTGLGHFRWPVFLFVGGRLRSLCGGHPGL